MPSQSWQTQAFCALLICSLVGASTHGMFEKGTKADRKKLGQASRVTNLYFENLTKRAIWVRNKELCSSVPTEAKLIIPACDLLFPALAQTSL